MKITREKVLLRDAAKIATAPMVFHNHADSSRSLEGCQTQGKAFMPPSSKLKSVDQENEKTTGAFPWPLLIFSSIVGVIFIRPTLSAVFV